MTESTTVAGIGRPVVRKEDADLKAMWNKAIDESMADGSFKKIAAR